MLNKILLVEDETSTSNYIYHKLEQLDCDVLAKASNNKDAIRMARELKPNLILMDIFLEGETDGIDTASQILSFLDVPVVFITERSDEDTIKRLMRIEPNAFIIKPFDERILRSAINIAIYRHQTKKELLQAKEMLRTTLESIDDIIISFDNEGHLTYIHSNQRIPFFTSGNQLQKHYNEVFPNYLVSLLDVCFDNVMKTKKVQEFEFEMQIKNSVRWFQAKASLRKDATGKAIGVTLLVGDISKQKKLEKELKGYSEKLKEAHEVTQLGTCVIDFSKNTFTHNGIFFELLDIEDYDDIKSHDDEKILRSIYYEDKIRYVDYHKDVFKKNVRKFSIDFRIVDKRKNIRYIHSVGKVDYDMNNNPAFMLLTIQDVSWQKQSQQLWKDLFTARKAAEIKQQFFTNVSYQLRTPLTEIIGMTELLNTTDLKPHQKKYLSTLRNSSETLINMISDILDVSRIEAAKMDLYPVEYDIRKDIEKIFKESQHIAEEKQIELKYTVDSKLPDILLVDQKRVNQIIINLMSNALKFTSEGSVIIRVMHVSKKGKEFTIRVEVEDTGVGIRKEDHADLFNAFQQTYHKRKRSSLGSGLGLYICKNLVNLLGGEIGLDSETGHGSTFWFTFKARECKGSVDTKRPVITKESVPKELDISVLLVEDKEENQKVLSLMLECIGCNVEVASNGKEAIELYQESIVNAFGIFGNTEYDIIIMDMYMPVMDGIAATHELRENFDEPPPIIGLSASVLDCKTKVYEELGFDDYLTKPVEIEILAKKLFYWKNKRKKQLAKKTVVSDEMFIRNIEKYPLINEHTINNIIKNIGGDALNVKKLINSFNEDMDDYYQRFVKAFKNNDKKVLKKIIMDVKGLSAIIGAIQVYEVTKKMEYHAEEENFDQVKKLFRIMINKYRIFKNYVVKRYLKH